ncbi:MAG: hypothetical protein M1839_003650 [Geoglossum umbratile]|nr:MAG: hypothetical protein M1839_003650 [Geoglossum umbratile]
MPAISEQEQANQSTLPLQSKPIMTIQELHALATRSRSRAEELIDALTNLIKQAYTTIDARKNRDIVEYAQDVIRYAKLADFDSELHQLLWVWGNLDPELRSLDCPTHQTTTPQFMETLRQSQESWHQSYGPKKTKFMNCHDCGDTRSSKVRKLEGKTFCNRCGLVNRRKRDKTKKTKTSTDTALNKSGSPDSPPRSDPLESPPLWDSPDSPPRSDPPPHPDATSADEAFTKLAWDGTAETTKTTCRQGPFIMPIDEAETTGATYLHNLDPGSGGLFTMSIDEVCRLDPLQQDIVAVSNGPTEVTRATETAETTYLYNLDPNSGDLFTMSIDEVCRLDSSSQQDITAVMSGGPTEVTKTAETTYLHSLDPNSADVFTMSIDEVYRLDSPSRQNTTMVVWGGTTQTMYQQDSNSDPQDLSIPLTDKVAEGQDICPWDSSLQQDVTQQDSNLDLGNSLSLYYLSTEILA